ncbi:MAG: lamin tail domain-containing protein [Calditrichota bacterium]
MPLAVLLLLLTSPIYTQQIVFSEIMFDPAGSERSDEFIEVLNLSTDSLDLTGWTIADSLSGDAIIPADSANYVLAPMQYAVIFDADYFSLPAGTYDNLIPPEAVVLSLDGVTFGNGGLTNSRAKTIYLISASGDTVAAYRYSVDNSPGYSDEKIEPSGGDEVANWANSRAFNGTPGKQNSRTRPEVAIEVPTFENHDTLRIAGGVLDFRSLILNTGRLAVSGVESKIFQDINMDSTYNLHERAIDFSYPYDLAPGDSLELQIDFPNAPAGRIQICMRSIVRVGHDSASSVQCWSGSVDEPRASLVINEIMAAPRSGEGEWIELANAGTEVFDLSTILFTDGKDTCSVIENLMLLPGEFRILSNEVEVIAEYTIPEERFSLCEGFPLINNDFDRLEIIGKGGWIYEAVPFDDSWYGRDVENGVSLEKYNPRFNGKMKESWNASIHPEGHSAGKPNSVFVDVLPEASRLTVQPNPFSPDGDGREDFCLFRYQLPERVSNVALRLFDLRGRQIAVLAEGETSASEGEMLWNGKSDVTGKVPSGIYICLFEARGLSTGRFFKEKTTIVLVRR